MKQTIRLNERELHRLISESVKRIINENDFTTSDGRRFNSMGGGMVDLPDNGIYADGTNEYGEMIGDDTYGYNPDVRHYNEYPSDIRAQYPEGVDGDNEYSWDCLKNRSDMHDMMADKEYERSQDALVRESVRRAIRRNLR